MFLGPLGALAGGAIGAAAGGIAGRKMSKEEERLEKERQAEAKRQADMSSRLVKLSEPQMPQAGVVAAPSTVASAASGLSTYDRWMRSMFGG